MALQLVQIGEQVCNRLCYNSNEHGLAISSPGRHPGDDIHIMYIGPEEEERQSQRERRE
jgi:hypothetical protein